MFGSPPAAALALRSVVFERGDTGAHRAANNPNRCYIWQTMACGTEAGKLGFERLKVCGTWEVGGGATLLIAGHAGFAGEDPWAHHGRRTRETAPWAERTAAVASVTIW